MKVTTLKGIFPDPKPVRRKNFIYENVKNLRRMEQCFQANKEIEELQKLKLRKHCKAADKYQNVSSRVITSSQGRKKESDNNDLISKNNIDSTLANKVESKECEFQNETSAVEIDKKFITSVKKIVKSGIDNDASGKQKKQDRTGKHETHQRLQPKILSNSNVLHKFNNAANYMDEQNVKYRSQGIQTLDTDQIESIYSEGVIRYPSKKVTKHGDIMIDKQEKIMKEQSDSLANSEDMCTLEDMRKLNLRNSISPAFREQMDLIKLNKKRTTVASKLVAQLNNGELPTNYRKGVVPKYLRERKEAQQMEQKAKAETSHSDCPEGHVPLPDHERKETLRLLRKNYQDYVNELNIMPIKTDTLRAQKRKIEIEKQLTKLEEGIKVFSRPKVYVKINI